MRVTNLDPKAIYYAFIEATLATAGFVQSKDIQDTFGMSRQKSSEVLSNYMNQHPGQAVRDRQGFSASDTFALNVIRGIDPKVYLKLVEKLLEASTKLSEVA